MQNETKLKSAPIHFKSLKKRLLIIVLGISTIATTITTVLNFYLEYDDELNLLKKSVTQVERSSVPSLVISLWNMSLGEVKTLLNGISTSNDFVKVYITDPNGKIIEESSKDISNVTTTFTQTIELKYSENDYKESLGHLHIVLSKDLIFHRLYSKLVNIIITQTVKVFLVSFLLLHFFSTLVTNRILKVDKFFKEYDWSFSTTNGDLIENSKKFEVNEIDTLLGSINLSLELMKDSFNESKRLREVADRAIKTERQFVANMSHELRTPLNSILGMSDMLEEEKLSDEARKYLGIQKKAGESLLSLINDVLDFSKIDSKNLAIEKTSLNIVTVCKDVISILESSAKDKDINLKIAFPNELTDEHYLSDIGKIRQILLNLVSNGIKYSLGTQISMNIKLIEKHDDADDIIIDVTDNGNGIRKEDLKSIFEPFQRSYAKTNRTIEGTGLGLAISKELAILMGGGIEVNSTVGKGSTFSVILSLKKDLLHNSIEKSKRKEVAFSDFPQINILAVDDNDDNLTLLSTYLKKTNANLIIAKNGKEGFDSFKTNPDIHLVLMDVQMPLMDGHEATVAIRNFEKENQLSPVPIITLTAANSKEDIEKSHEIGANLHLVKPIKRKVLFSTIIEILDKTKDNAA